MSATTSDTTPESTGIPGSVGSTVGDYGPTVTFSIDGVEYTVEFGQHNIIVAFNGGISVGKSTALLKIAGIMNYLFENGIIPFMVACEFEPVTEWQAYNTYDLMGNRTGDVIDILGLSYDHPETHRVPMQYGLLGTHADRYMNLAAKATDVPTVYLIERDLMAGQSFVVAGKSFFTDFEITMFYTYANAIQRAINMLEAANVIPRSGDGVYFQTATETQMMRMMKRKRASEMTGVSADYLSRLNQIMDIIYHGWKHFDCTADLDDPESPRYKSQYDFYEPIILHIIEQFVKMTTGGHIDVDVWKVKLREAIATALNDGTVNFEMYSGATDPEHL